jgi:hypothetical protein
MSKWLRVVALLMMTGLLVAAPSSAGDDMSGVATPVITSTGGGPGEPIETMADTTADIYIYVTLRQPPGPPAPSFYIDTTNVTPQQLVRFKATQAPAERSDCNWYAMYREEWPLFTWNDIYLFGGTRRDSTKMIDPHEDPFTHGDAGQYRWNGPNTTYDFFADTLWTPAPGRKGIGDWRVNWFYTAIAVDSNETDGRILNSPEPAPPVGEIDQLLGVSAGGRQNIVSYPV